MSAVDNALWKLQSNMLAKSSADICGRKLNTKGRRLYFTIASCSLVAILLVLGVLYGETYDKRKYNSRREVKPLNEESKHLPNEENSVEKRTILKPWEQVRLPSNIRPNHYDILIQVYLNELRFTGKFRVYLFK